MARRRKGLHPLTRARQINRTVGIVLGDAQAIRRGRVGPRIVNRVIGRGLGALMRGVWR